MRNIKDRFTRFFSEGTSIDQLKKDHYRIRQNFDKAGGADALQKIRLFLEESGENARLGLSASYYSISDLLSQARMAPRLSVTKKRDEISQALTTPAIISGKILKEIRISIHYSQLPDSTKWIKQIFIEITSSGVMINSQALKSGTTLDSAVKTILTS